MRKFEGVFSRTNKGRTPKITRYKIFTSQIGFVFSAYKKSKLSPREGVFIEVYISLFIIGMAWILLN
jgi:hypothetical protein